MTAQELRFALKDFNLVKLNRIKLLVHTTTWMNLKNMLSRRSQTQTSTYYMILFT